MRVEAGGVGCEPAEEVGGRGASGRLAGGVDRDQCVGYPALLVCGRAVKLTPRDVLEQRHSRVAHDEHTLRGGDRSPRGEACVGQSRSHLAPDGKGRQFVVRYCFGDVGGSCMLDAPGAGVHSAAHRCHRRAVECPVHAQDVSKAGHVGHPVRTTRGIGQSPRTRTRSPPSTCWGPCNASRRTVPAIGAVIEASIFIASIVATVAPASTEAPSSTEIVTTPS